MRNLHVARKRFGQNFLIDQNIIQKIIRAIAPTDDDNLVEIGPGLGAITQPLLECCKRLTVIELDRDLARRLNEKFAAEPGKLTVIQQDALKTDFTAIELQPPLRIVGNLPYNISTPLLFHLLRSRSAISDMHFMLQKEVVERLAASPGCKAYGRLSVMVQYCCEVQPLFDVPPTAFQPAPKVLSTVVRLLPRAPLTPAKDETLFARLVALAFQQRRKTLRNTLKLLSSSGNIDACLAALSLTHNVRPEELSVTEFAILSNKLTTLL